MTPKRNAAPNGAAADVNGDQNPRVFGVKRVMSPNDDFVLAVIAI
jgi:hypothetical protein